VHESPWINDYLPLWYKAVAARGWVEKLDHVEQMLDILVCELQRQAACFGATDVTAIELFVDHNTCYNSVQGVGIMAKGKATQLTPIAS
jgi:hypothetical protein